MVTPVLDRVKGVDAAKKELAELMAKAVEEAKKVGGIGIANWLRNGGGGGGGLARGAACWRWRCDCPLAELPANCAMLAQRHLLFSVRMLCSCA